MKPLPVVTAQQDSELILSEQFNPNAVLSRDQRERLFSEAQMTYLITFACYGCHLHGAESGSVDRKNNIRGRRLIEVDPKRASAERRRMDQPPYQMDSLRRDAVLASLQERCLQQRWTLLAAHVRTSHVHLVADSEALPERMMNDLKSYASRCLNRINVDGPGRKRWARHGSTRWLWQQKHVSAAVRYVVSEQGDVMSVFEKSSPDID